MKVTEQIAQHLLDVHNGDNWTDVNIANTLKGITWQEADRKASFSPNTIAMLLHHISFWNRIVAQRGQGIEPVIPPSNGMDVPAIESEEAWNELKKDNLLSAHELATIIENFDEDDLHVPILPRHSSAYKNFQGQVEHVHYHLGQIVMIKKYLHAL